MIIIRKEQGNVIELVIIGVLVLGVIGLLVWRFTGASQLTSQSPGAESKASTSTVTDTSSQTSTSLAQFTSKKYLIRFWYPSAWSVSEKIYNDETDWYSSAVTVKDQGGNIVAQLSTGGQFGGGCPEDSVYLDATTITDAPVTIRGIGTAHYGYTIVKNEAGGYNISYGLNNGTLAVGTKKIQCPGMSINYKYIVNASNSALGAMIFGSWVINIESDAKAFGTLEEAKSYASSDVMKQVEAMVTSLSIGE
jgi:hypothetical protein